MKWLLVLTICLIPAVLCKPTSHHNRKNKAHPKLNNFIQGLLSNSTAYNAVLESPAVLNETQCTLDQTKLIEFLLENCTQDLHHLNAIKNFNDLKAAMKTVCAKDNYINQHNNNATNTFKLGHNCFSHKTAAEMEKHKGLKVHAARRHGAKRDLQGLQTDFAGGQYDTYTNNGLQIPDSYDWRQNGFNPTIQNQGSCGCCWAFSTALLMEFLVWKNTQQSVVLSKQQYIDCTYTPSGQQTGYQNQGCNGGFPTSGIDYNTMSTGQCLETDYPFAEVSWDENSQPPANQCNVPQCQQSFMAASHFLAANGDDQAVREMVVNNGVLSILIDASDPAFQQYTSGVYSPGGQNCNAENPDHAVNLVGYGTDPDTNLPYWIVQNQWGDQWGQNGFIWIAADKPNNCFVSTGALTAVLAQ